MGTRSATRPVKIATGDHQRPRPGYVRADSLHQGDLDQGKGVHHINVLDSMTQHQLAGSAE